MNNIFCVRADFGRYKEDFIKGGFVAIGWLWGTNLSHIQSRDKLYPLYKADRPEDNCAPPKP